MDTTCTQQFLDRYTRKVTRDHNDSCLRSELWEAAKELEDGLYDQAMKGNLRAPTSRAEQ